MKVAEQIRNYIVQNLLFDDKAKLEATDSLLEAGAIDSTGVMDLVTYIEAEYGIKVLDDELTPDNLDSIEKIARFIDRKLDVKLQKRA